MSEKFYLPEPLREVATNHFRLLEAKNVNRKRDVLELSLSGYGDVMFLIADIVKVCLLALEGVQTENCSRVVEPTSNISGVLELFWICCPMRKWIFWIRLGKRYWSQVKHLKRSLF